MLKLVRCIIAAENWEPTFNSLVSVGALMTVYDTFEHSPERIRTAVYRGHEYAIHLHDVVVEVVTDETWVDDIIATVEKAQSVLTGHGAIQVFPVEESYRIRDGFMDLR